MSKLNTDWPMDRVLTDEMRSKIKSAFRRNLSTSGPRAETELTDGLPLDVDVILLRRFEETLLHVEVLIERDEHPELVVDDAMDCPHHVDGDRLSTLADMGEEYADLEQDLLSGSGFPVTRRRRGSFKIEIEERSFPHSASKNRTLYSVFGPSMSTHSSV
ncbi:hypothetical protein [Halorussus rarus]|nr:hypothetical protein [Halorussus rarus]